MPDAAWRGTIPPYDVEPDDEPTPRRDTILSEKERRRAEFIGTTLAIMQGHAAEVHPTFTGGAVIVVGSRVWKRWHEHAEGFWADYDPPDHPF
jgi:hypothetical protein